MTIYLATNNKNKVREMREILPNHTILTPLDAGLTEFDPKETGDSFFSNALIKARTLWDALPLDKKNPVLADDSGITLDILGDVPGIYSARYAGEDFPKGCPDGRKLSQLDQNAALIHHLNNAIEKGLNFNGNLKNGARSTHYTCCLVLYTAREEFVASQSIMEGVLVDDIKKASGTGGFGYDPIFFLPALNKTAAQLSADEKNAISHRGKALRALIPFLNNCE